MFSNLLGTKVLMQSMQAALKGVPEGMAPKAKVKMLAGLDYDLDALFTSEEQAVRQSEIDGQPVQRRADVLPQYVLAQ